MEEEELLREIEHFQIKLDTCYIDLTERLIKIKRKVERHNILHQNCQEKGFQDIVFTTITYGEVKELAEETNEYPAHIIVDKYTEDEKETELIPRCATDGSVLNKRGRKVAAYGVYFGEGSPLNEAGIVNNSASSMIPEIAGITRALQVAKDEALTKLFLITDNIPSIIFTTLAKQSPINSRTLQNYLNENPVLEDYAMKIKNLINEFKFLAIIWQKSHTNSLSINSKYNEGADQLARYRAEEILNKITQ